MLFWRGLGWAGLFLIAGLGAAVGGWITNSQYPVQVLGRKLVTTTVKPGDDVEIELDNYRLTRCEQTVYRIITYPDGKRSTIIRDVPSRFGKLGHDRYITTVPTNSQTVFGKASIYSYGEARCNPWEWLFPKSSGDPWVDQFEFGPETVRIDPAVLPERDYRPAR